jgi:hypothetical protein
VVYAYVCGMFPVPCGGMYGVVFAHVWLGVEHECLQYVFMWCVACVKSVVSCVCV